MNVIRSRVDALNIFCKLSANVLEEINNSFHNGKCGSLNLSQPYGPPWPVKGISLLYFTLLKEYKLSSSRHGCLCVLILCLCYSVCYSVCR
jgi:hypothetical protein